MKRKIRLFLFTNMLFLSMLILTITANAQENIETTEQSTTDLTTSITTEITTTAVTNTTLLTVPPPHWVSDISYENSDLIGNAELVEGQTVLFESELFSFVSVQTKAGNIFYIFIDRRLETSNVYFLNKVDEYDLLSIIYDQKQANADGEETGAAPKHPYQTELNGMAITSIVSDTETGENGDPVQPPKKKPIINAVQLIFLIFILIAGAGLFVYLKMSGNKSSKKCRPTIDEYDETDEDFPE